MTSDAKRKLKPCENNVWYLLATAHNPQTGDNFYEINNGLAARNRATWNRYVA